MPVKSLKDYVGVPRDTAEGFDGNQLTYVSWDHHLLFAAPFLLYTPSDMPFGEFVDGPLTALIGPDPDADKVDFRKVEWLLSNQPFTPDFDKSLAENGIKHKFQLRFKTPGVSTLVPV